LEDGHAEGTNRIETFSDGVFAIAITLLIIEISVPAVAGDQGLGAALLDEWPSYFAYVLSFIMIGIYWANHHSFFQLFHHSDHWFLMINVVFLMAIAFMPFPTAVLAQYLDDASQRETAVAFYATGLLLPAVCWFAIWIYGNMRGLLVHDLDPSYVRYFTRQYGISVSVYAAAVALALVNAWLGLAVCVGLTALYILPPRRPRFAG
jgi:uncharacterized membrane protein